MIYIPVIFMVFGGISLSTAKLHFLVPELGNTPATKRNFPGRKKTTIENFQG